MDGKRFDPVDAFVKHYRWSGVILEPLSDLFAALVANHADAPQASLLNAALMDSDGTQEITRVGRAASQSGLVPDWAEAWARFTRRATRWAAWAWTRTSTRRCCGTPCASACRA